MHMNAMHEDSLERFVREHRSSMEQESPDPAVWARLEKSLGEVPGTRRSPGRIIPMRRSPKRWISAAAVLLLCVSLAAFIRTYQVRQVEETAIPADLLEAQAYYETRISQGLDRIKRLSQNQPGRTDTSLWQLMAERDQEYQRLRQALGENPGNAHVRAAFVEYYRSRLEVLRRVEEHLGDAQHASGLPQSIPPHKP